MSKERAKALKAIAEASRELPSLTIHAIVNNSIKANALEGYDLSDEDLSWAIGAYVDYIKRKEKEYKKWKEEKETKKTTTTS